VTNWAETLAGFRTGDLDATNQIIALITRYLASIGAFGLRDSWDDLVQEVLISLLRHPPDSPEPGAIVRHIQTTSYRRYIDEIRRLRGRQRPKEVEGEGEEAEGPGWRRNVSFDEIPEASQVEDFWARQLDVGVQLALDRLDERQRRALEAVYLVGFTYEEAAAQLDTPLGTLKGLLRDGLADLRKQLLGESEPS
jgi:RNA polymerase sigma-70 factor (ECF subfamily)